jgi:hypothetical protein
MHCACLRLAVGLGLVVPLTVATPLPSSRFVQPAVTTSAKIGTQTAKTDFGEACEPNIRQLLIPVSFGSVGPVEQKAGNATVTDPVTPL